MLRWQEDSRGYRLSTLRLGEACLAAVVPFLLWTTTLFLRLTGKVPHLDTDPCLGAWLTLVGAASAVAAIAVLQVLRYSSWLEIGLKGRRVTWRNRQGPSQFEPVEASTFDAARFDATIGGQVWDTSYRVVVVLGDGLRIPVLDDWETGEEPIARELVSRLNELLEAAASRDEAPHGTAP